MHIEGVPNYRLVLKREGPSPGQLKTVVHPEDFFAIVAKAMSEEPSEVIVVGFLDTQGKLIGLVTAGIGTKREVKIATSEIFRAAILANAVSIIIAHNHPSGNTTPSPEDITATNQIVAAGEILRIAVLDHLIIGFDGQPTFVSLRERGIHFS